ncbi:MAG: hypothetical protein JO100_07085 [Pseudonocardia sp.]|jgi:hypothetical protein|nr:hypothetical protein [Pseudonocardia sp.]
MKGLFWLGLGIATGVVVTRRLTVATRQLTPAGISEQIGDGLRELALALGEFGADVRAGMAERERELTELVEVRTGQPLPRVIPAPQALPATRARRAGGLV